MSRYDRCAPRRVTMIVSGAPELRCISQFFYLLFSDFFGVNFWFFDGRWGRHRFRSGCQISSQSPRAWIFLFFPPMGSCTAPTSGWAFRSYFGWQLRRMLVGVMQSCDDLLCTLPAHSGAAGPFPRGSDAAGSDQAGGERCGARAKEIEAMEIMQGKRGESGILN